ncbi:MAG: DUF11 domain-containing protein [Candidatus Nomurabacteria bacterium]|nr:MAG: DUF11 domain-containing protein [Candidatus Nomurabacteria bacterium]
MRIFALKTLRLLSTPARSILVGGLIFGLIAQPLLSAAAVLPLDQDGSEGGGGGIAPQTQGTDQLVFEKTFDTNSPAGMANYILSYENTGAVPVYNAVVTDTLPDELQYLSSTPSGNEAGGVIKWDLGTLGAGVSGEIYLSTVIDNEALENCADLTNTANLQAKRPDTTPVDHRFDITVTSTENFCPMAPDLSITKTIVEEQLGYIDYTLTYENNGDWPAYNVEIRDVLPSGLADMEIDPQPTLDGNDAVWNIDAIQPGDGDTISFRVWFDASQATCGPIVNTATITQQDGPTLQAQYRERNLSNNESQVSTQQIYGICTGTIQGQKWNDEDANGIWDNAETGLEGWTINLLTSCSQDFDDYNYDSTNDVIDLGDFVGWTDHYVHNMADADLNQDGILSKLDLSCLGIWFNNGPITDSMSLVASDVTDANGNYVFDGLEKGSYWLNETMQDGWEQSFPLLDPIGPYSIISDGQVLQGSDFGNHVIDDGDNQGERTPVITLEKEALANASASGANVSYLLNYTVADATATNLVLVDQLPQYTNFISASDSGVYDANARTVTWSLGTVNPGSYSVSITLALDDTIPDGTVVTNTALLSGDRLTQIQDNAEVTVSSQPVLSVEKLVNVSTAKTGETLLYTVRISNEGSDVAHNVSLSDVLPQGFLTTENSLASFTKNLGDLAVGDSISTSYEVTVGNSVSSGDYVNTATARADNADPVTATATVSVSAGQVLGVSDEASTEDTNTAQGQVLGAEDTLPETGAGVMDYLLLILASVIIVAGALTLRRSYSRSHLN